MEIVNAIIGNIKHLLSIRFHHILLISALVSVTSLAVLLLPKEVIEFLHIDNLRANNLDKIGAVTFLATSVVVFCLLLDSGEK